MLFFWKFVDEGTKRLIHPLIESWLRNKTMFEFMSYCLVWLAKAHSYAKFLWRRSNLSTKYPN